MTWQKQFQIYKLKCRFKFSKFIVEDPAEIIISGYLTNRLYKIIIIKEYMQFVINTENLKKFNQSRSHKMTEILKTSEFYLGY